MNKFNNLEVKKMFYHHDGHWITNHLEELTNTHESASQSNPWSLSDAPKEYTDKLVKAVVDLEIDIEDIIGNFKLSQNKATDDYDGVVAGLDGLDNELESMVSMQMLKNKKRAST